MLVVFKYWSDLIITERPPRACMPLFSRVSRLDHDYYCDITVICVPPQWNETHQSSQSLYIAWGGWNRKNFNQLTFHKWKFLLFGWQRTPSFDLALSLFNQTLRNNTTRVHLFGLTNKATWHIKSLMYSAKMNCHTYLWIHTLPITNYILALNKCHS